MHIKTNRLCLFFFTSFVPYNNSYLHFFSVFLPLPLVSSFENILRILIWFCAISYYITCIRFHCALFDLFFDLFHFSGVNAMSPSAMFTYICRRCKRMQVISIWKFMAVTNNFCEKVHIFCNTIGQGLHRFNNTTWLDWLAQVKPKYQELLVWTNCWVGAIGVTAWKQKWDMTTYISISGPNIRKIILNGPRLQTVWETEL